VLGFWHLENQKFTLGVPTYDTPFGVAGVISRCMIGHQGIGVETAVMYLTGFMQQVQVKPVVIF